MKEGYEFVANSFSSSLNKQVETVKAKAVEHFNFGRRDGRVANKFYAKDLLGLEFALNSFAN